MKKLKTESKQEAVIYIRVSTTQQAVEGVSLDAQEAKAEAWCLLNDYSVKSIHRDEGISGRKTNNRPALAKALEDCTNGNALVVYSISRLSRSTADTLAIGDKLKQAGADLVSISEKIDTTSAADKMVFRLMAVMSEFESDQISERVSVGMQYKKSKGGLVGAVPYGSQLAADGDTLEPNEKEQEIIKIVKDLKRDGMTMNKISIHLNTTTHHPRGKKWYPEQIKRILLAA